jgi:hypothetical protein
VLARNHCATIAKCIAGIFAAHSYSGWHNSLWIVVVADGSTDHTAKVARGALGAFGQVLEVSAGTWQAAHHIGATAVMEHFPGVPRHTLLLTNMDATADLPRDWIDRQLQGAQSPVGLETNHRL